MIKEPDWDMLKDPKIVDTLFHLNGHFNIVSKLEPKTIEIIWNILDFNPYNIIIIIKKPKKAFLDVVKNNK